MKIGAMDGVLGGGGDPAVFERAKRLGVDGVEISLKITEIKDPNCPRIAALRDLSQKHAVAIPSGVLGEHNSGGIATWWRGKDADDEVLASLRFLKAVDATTLLLPFFFMNEPKGRSHRLAVAERLKPLAAEAENLGIALAYEGVTPPEPFAEMARIVNSPAFGQYVDPANITWCDRDAPTEIMALTGWIKQAHAKDAKVFTGDARLGEGKVDHAACARAYTSCGFDGWVVLETPGGSDEQVGADVAFARRVYG